MGLAPWAIREVLVETRAVGRGQRPLEVVGQEDDEFGAGECVAGHHVFLILAETAPGAMTLCLRRRAVRYSRQPNLVRYPDTRSTLDHANQVRESRSVAASEKLTNLVRLRRIRFGRGAARFARPQSTRNTQIVVALDRGDSFLLERDRELEVVDGLVLDALDARPAVALVQGPAGIGKTRLLVEARERAGAEGFRVLAARGGELERELPFGVVRQLFE